MSGLPFVKPYCFYSDVHYFYVDDDDYESVQLVLSVSPLSFTLIKGHYSTC